MPSFCYIDTPAKLQDCCLLLQNSQLLAVDTEFVRERTFFPQPGLIQVSDGDQIYLIDPIACPQLEVFFQLLESPDIRIIMHSSSEDIELFNFMGCGIIQNLFDTQIAASWLGMGQSLSLQKLIQQFESVEIEKQLSRTNWLKRPLSEAQLEYAAVDVLYLNSICIQQELALTEQGFLKFMLEDCDLRCEKKSIEENDRTAYLKVKRAITVSGEALIRLQLLASWREQQARLDDKPRQHLLKDQQLLDISIENPETLEQLTVKCNLPPFIVRRYGKQLIKVITDYSHVNNEIRIAKPALSLRSLPSAGKTLNAIRELMIEIHKQQQIPREVLPSKRWLEQFLLHQVADWYPLPEGWKGWRKNLLQQPLLDSININHFNMEQ